MCYVRDFHLRSQGERRGAIEGRYDERGGGGERDYTACILLTLWRVVSRCTGPLLCFILTVIPPHPTRVSDSRRFACLGCVGRGG